MSRLTTLLNLIKTSAGEFDLTPSQQEALGKIEHWLNVHQICNLYGPNGSGKTYLAWRVAGSLGLTYRGYISADPGFTQGTGGLALDCAPTQRSAFRNLLASAQVHRRLPLLLLTQHPIDDDIPLVELRCSAEDIGRMKANMGSIGYYLNDCPAANLWSVIDALMGDI